MPKCLPNTSVRTVHEGMLIYISGACSRKHTQLSKSSTSEQPRVQVPGPPCNPCERLTSALWQAVGSKPQRQDRKDKKDRHAAHAPWPLSSGHPAAGPGCEPRSRSGPGPSTAKHPRAKHKEVDGTRLSPGALLGQLLLHEGQALLTRSLLIQARVSIGDQHVCVCACRCEGGKGTKEKNARSLITQTKT